MSYHQQDDRYQQSYYGDPDHHTHGRNYEGNYGQTVPNQGQGVYAQDQGQGQGQAQGGGPVQPAQSGYQEGHRLLQIDANGGRYSGQQQPYQTSPYEYNPSTYAPSPPFVQQTISTYNPAAYVSVDASPNSAYPPVPAHRPTSGPLPDPYTYSPGNYSNPGYSPQVAFANSPATSQGQFSPQQRHAPHPPPPPPRQSFTASPPLNSYGYQYSPGPSQTYPHQSWSQPQSSNGTAMPVQSTSSATSLPYPAEPWMPSPPSHGFTNGARPSPSSLYQSAANGSFPSPPSSNTPGPTPPPHSFVNSYGASDHDPDRGYFAGSSTAAPHSLSLAERERLSQEALYDEVETAVRRAGSTAGRHSPSISVSRAPNQATAPYLPTSPVGAVRRNGSMINGHLSPGPPSHIAAPMDPFSDDSDVEANQGLAMLRADIEDEARRGSNGDQLSLRSPGYREHDSPADDSGFEGVPVDMSSFEGGYDPHTNYSGDLSQQNSVRSSGGSRSSRSGYDLDHSIHPFPPFNPAATVNVSGTGGLSEPRGGRRQSYDEGDEYDMTETQLPERFPDEPPDLFNFTTSRRSYSSARPLPATPNHPPSLQTQYKDSLTQSPFAPDTYAANGQGQYVPRSTSLLNHSNTPQVSQPLRSKTDAEERRIRQLQSRQTILESVSASSVVPELPLLGSSRFIPAKLGAPDFKKCAEPWALSSILTWLLAVISSEQFTELKEVDIADALVALFTNKVPTMNIADAEVLSNRVVQNMYKAGTLAVTEEWVKLVPGTMSGVIFQLTGVGCYSRTLHDHLLPGRCYSRFCQRTLRKINLQHAHSARGPESWMSKWNLTAADVEGKDSKTVQRQHVLHETVFTEEVYMEQLEVLRTLYRDALMRHEPSIITPNRKEKFMRDVFGRLESVYKANEEHLLPQLKYRQEEQGPWIEGFSDIFRQWIRKAKSAYLEYAAEYPKADFTLRHEIERNLDFRAFLDRTSRNPQSLRLGWASFLKAPITRLQRYSLLMDTIYKTMKTESEERRNLETAIKEIKAVTMECDTRVAEMQRKVDLTDLNLRLVLRPGMQDAVELNLDHYGREVIHRGDLQRMGSSRFNWLDTHAILFDHYLVISKPIAPGTDQFGISATQKYDVSRLPIPMDLLILESSNDPAVQKSNYVKGISTVTTVSSTRVPTDLGSMGRTPSNQVPGSTQLQHVNTSNSTNSLTTVSTLGEGKDDKIMYPFRVKHLGRETYNLFASSESSRREWCAKIIEAKTKHAAALYAQNAEPFQLKVMADSAFSYEGFAGGKSGVVIKGTPVDRAIKEVEHRFKDTGRPGPICRARVNCATSFTAQNDGKTMIAVGTDFGVFVSDLDNPRGWMKISVLEDFNLFLLVADKVLIAYHLDIVCPSDPNGPIPSNDSGRKAPQKLSGSKDVGFFVSGRMKDRHLVFYKKKENLTSVFKVLEPIYQKSTEKKSRNVFKRGNTEFFREYDEFYIPAECSGMNVFHSSLAVSTARGFEVLTLDKKVAYTVPELKSPEVQLIAQHIKDQKALAMLRLTDSEFLLCYSNCAVYANKHGEVSRSVIMDFVGTAQSAALYGAYLILFDNDFVEIRNASNGRLKQIIAGREIKCLDDGGSWSSASSAAAAAAPTTAVNGQSTPHEPRTVKFVMQHPEPQLERTQIIVELVINEKMRE
nr:rho1 guanine nucleotide exchange factor 3 [Quercus suber]